MNDVILCISNENSHMPGVISCLKDRNCKVYTLESPEKEGLTKILAVIEKEAGYLDMLLLGTNENMPKDGIIGSGHDDDKLLTLLDREINGTREAIESALPLLRKGNRKRIGVITKAESGITLCRERENYGEHMALAGINMLGKIYFNRLRPEGFTFRWYCASGQKGGMSAGEYFLTNFSYDANEPCQHSEENRLVMKNQYLQEIPW